MPVSRGFTLIELLFVIAAAAILLTVGIPSFQNSVRSNRLTSSVNDLIASLQVARSEAIKRRAPVVMCTTGGAVDPAAGCTAAPWHLGWLIFADDNANGSRDANEPALRLEGNMRKGIVVRTPQDQPLQDRLVYSSAGFPALGGLAAAGVLVFCDDQSSDFFGRVIAIPQTGRPVAATILNRPDLGVSCE